MWRKVLPTKPVLQCPGVTARSPLWGSAAPQCAWPILQGETLSLVSHTAPCATHQPQWTFLGLPVDELTRLALNPYCSHCDHQTGIVPPSAKHLIKRKILKVPVAVDHLLQVYIQLCRLFFWPWFLLLCLNCNKNNILTFISDPEEIQNAKNQDKLLFLQT